MSIIWGEAAGQTKSPQRITKREAQSILRLITSKQLQTNAPQMPELI